MAEFHVRRLPHLHAVGIPVFLTWRLAGSLPANRSFSEEVTSGKRFVAMDRILDTARTGPLYLKIPEIAQTVVGAIRYRADSLCHYELHNFVVMANHVHLLVTPRVLVLRLTHSLKRFTAKEANRILNRTGQPFWPDESYDGLVRDATEFCIARYIELNPVRAGLAPTPENFLWSGARPIDNRPQVNNLPH